MLAADAAALSRPQPQVTVVPCSMSSLFCGCPNLCLLLPGDELLGSFPSWLASMGLTTVSLSQDALDKMRTLWAKAKEAVQLQALVDNLKESELQLAQQEAAENERHVDLLVCVRTGSRSQPLQRSLSLPCPCGVHAARYPLHDLPYLTLTIPTYQLFLTCVPEW